MNNHSFEDVDPNCSFPCQSSTYYLCDIPWYAGVGSPDVCTSWGTSNPPMTQASDDDYFMRFAAANSFGIVICEAPYHEGVIYCDGIQYELSFDLAVSSDLGGIPPPTPLLERFSLGLSSGLTPATSTTGTPGDCSQFLNNLTVFHEVTDFSSTSWSPISATFIGDGQSNQIGFHSEAGYHSLISVFLDNFSLTCHSPLNPFFNWIQIGPTEIEFTNNTLPSNGISAVELQWEFPGPITSDEDNPTFDFGSPGTYEVCLDILDDCGCTNRNCLDVTVGTPFDPCFCNGNEVCITSQNNIFSNLGLIPGPNGILSNLVFLIDQDVDFIIDQNASFNSCQFIFQQGGSLQINSGVSTIISAGVLTTCDDSWWDGIKVAAAGRLSFAGNLIEHAEIAINMSSNTTLSSFAANDLIDNRIGLFIPDRSVFLTNNLIGNDFKAIDRIGNYDLGAFIGEQSTTIFNSTFINMGVGIFLNSCPAMRVAYSRFENITSGMSSTILPFRTVVRTGTAIYDNGISSNSSLRVLSNDYASSDGFYNVDYGIHSFGSQLECDKNHMEVNLRAVQLDLCNSFNFITSNSIETVGAGSEALIQINDQVRGRTTIGLNDIKIGACDDGIEANMAYSTVVNTNILDGRSSPTLASGVDANGSMHCAIDSNLIQGPELGEGINISMSGLGQSIQCNCIESVRNCLVMEDIGMDYEIKTNNFKFYMNLGLLYGLQAMVGQQVGAGNTWSHSQTRGALLQNPDLADQNRYEILELLGTNFWPGLTTAGWSPTDWFDNTGPSAEICSFASCDLESEDLIQLPIGTPEEDVGLTREIDVFIAEQVIPDSITDAIWWTAEYSLYHRLDQFPNLLGDSIFNAFHTTHSSLQGYIDLENDLNGVANWSILDEIKDSLDQLLDDGWVLDSTTFVQLPVNPTLETFFRDVDSLNEIFLQQVDSLFLVDSSFYESLKNDIDLLPYFGVYSDNIKLVSKSWIDLYFADSLTQTQITSLSNIAEQCPDYGGHPVYRARALLNIMNESYTEPSCYISSARGSLAEVPEKDEIDGITIYPNPSSGQISIAWNGEEAMNIKISDSQGKVMLYDNQVHSHQNFDLSPGLYIVDVWNNDYSYRKTGKIVVIEN